MSNLKELEKKYEELGEEIERLQEEEKKVNICKDHIFLLSVEEYKKYKDKIPLIDTEWWLRSPTYEEECVADVDCYGDVFGFGQFIDYDCMGIRPALRITPWQRRLSDDDGKIFRCGVTWIKIDKDLYIAEVPIAFRRFDGESNNYNTSEIQRFLFNWYKERINW